MEDGDKTARDFTTNRDESVRATDWREDGLWIIVLSMGGRNFCTYVGIPVDHPLADHDYDDLPVYCHGGLTYAGAGDGKYRPEGYYWYGWDYSHSGDYIFYGDDSFPKREDDKDWTLKEVKDDAWRAVYDFGKLKKLSETIYNRSKS